jgi:hypothetical protein
MTLNDQANWTTLRDLTARLNAVTREAAPEPDREEIVLRDADAIITHIEVNDRHGVGKLVQMMFQYEPNIISIRSASYHGGRNELGALSLSIAHRNWSRDSVFERVLHVVGKNTIRRILCVPYFPDDARNAIALKEIFGVPLCTYIMDDQNVCANGIADDLMRELLAKSRLRLAISPEMRLAYERKFEERFWYMPPLVPGRFVPSRLCIPHTPRAPIRGVIIGNIWGQQWLDLLRHTVRDSGVQLTWYCNGTLPCGEDELRADSIVPHDPLKDGPLVDMLRQFWFAVVPSGRMDADDDRRFLAQLSLPSRMPYMTATSHIPILVLGDSRSAAAHFVEQFGVGVVSSYQTAHFLEAVRDLMRPEINLAMRRRAFALSRRFIDTGSAEWIWQSLASAQAADGRYEDLLPRSEPDLSGGCKVES